MAGVVRAVDDDDVFSSAGESQPPIPQKSEVSGVEPAVGREDLSVRITVLIVSRRHHRTLDVKLPGVSLRQRTVIVIDDAQSDPGNWTAELYKRIVVACCVRRETL